MYNHMSMTIAVAVAILVGSVAMIVAAMEPAQSKPDDDVLAKKVTISLSKARIGAVARELATATGVAVNVEEARRHPLPGDAVETIVEIVERHEQGISIDVTDATIAEVLDELIAEDDRYEYFVDTDTGMINIYPREDAPMGWLTGPLSISDKTVREILVTDDILGLRERTIILFLRGNLSWLDNQVTLESEPASARQVLNALCAQLDFNARWELLEARVRNDRIYYQLTIYGIPTTGDRAGALE